MCGQNADIDIALNMWRYLGAIKYMNINIIMFSIIIVFKVPVFF
jgi:hypothetical protein